MNFLITGGAGFIGSHLSERFLREGHSVWAFDNLEASYDPELKRLNVQEIRALGKPFELVVGDIVDCEALDKVLSAVEFDQVVHLAGSAGVRPSLARPALYQRINVEGTVNVLEAARKNGVKKITIASSSSVYGINSKLPFGEGDPIFSAVSPYAASKLACEALGHVWHHNYGMDVVMLRFFTVYGPRQRPNLAIHKFARLLMAGEPIPMYGDGTAARDYTYITDILDGIIACTKKKFGFEIFNLGDSHPVALSELIQLLEATFSKKAVIEHHPEQAGDVPITFADISKARQMLGYDPRVMIADGLELFAKWFCANEELITQ